MGYVKSSYLSIKTYIKKTGGKAQKTKIQNDTQYQAVWWWRQMPSPSQIGGTVSQRLKAQSQGMVHPTVIFIQHQHIDTISKKSQQKQSILSQLVWHI